jgi:hypothetical protein
MEKNIKKRQAHGYANLLEDRFTLEKSKQGGKEPFRTWLGYREIADIQRSSTKPEFFVISVNSTRSNRKYYEVYKCKSREDAQKFESTVRQALSNPDYMVREGQPIDVVQVKDDPNRARSMVHLEFQTSLESLDDDNRASSMYQLTSPTPPEGYDYVEEREQSPLPQPNYKETYVHAAPSPSPSPKRVRTPSPIPAPRPVQAVKAAPVMATAPTYTSSGLEDVTYIQFDPRTRDPMAADEGPVYMYMYREDNTQQGNDYRNGSVTRIGNNTGGEYSPAYDRGTYNRDRTTNQYNY